MRLKTVDSGAVVSTQINFYTFSNMESAQITAITSEETGYPKENLLDNNPDTYWKPTSISTQTIDFDLGAARSVDAVCGFLRNYSLAGSYSATKWYSDNGSTWTQDTGNCVWGNMIWGPLRMTDLSVQSSHRYWRLVFSISAAQVPEFAGIWFARKYTLSIANQWPEPDEIVYENYSVAGIGGRRYVYGINKNSYEKIVRKYLIPNATQFGYLQSAFTDSYGDRFPLIINEGTLYSDARLVRFAKSTLNKNEIAYQVYNPTVEFYELPYIAYGDNY